MIPLNRQACIALSILIAFALPLWLGAAPPAPEPEPLRSTAAVLPQGMLKVLVPEKKTRLSPVPPQRGKRTQLPGYGEISQVDGVTLDATALVLSSSPGRLLVWAADKPGIIVHGDAEQEVGSTIWTLGRGELGADSFEMEAYSVGFLHSGTEESRQLAQRFLARVPEKMRASGLVLGISEWIGRFNTSLERCAREELATWVVEAALEQQIDPLLLASLVAQESGFDAGAVSSVGAMGLGQLMPDTADLLGVEDPYDPRENLRGAARYLSWQLERWRDTGDPVGLALASYNAGPGAVERYGGIPPYAETCNYVDSICSLYAQLRESPL